MERSRISPERVVAVVGLVFLLIATFVSIVFFNGDSKSIIEKFADTSIVIPVVHIICVILVVILLFKPSDYLMLCVLFIESELTILTDYKELGIFFFYAAIILIMSRNLIVRKTPKRISVLFVVHFITICLTFTHGIRYMLVSLGYSAFCCAFYFWIYNILKTKFSCLFPKNVTENLTIIKKPVGSVISLSEYNLNERQSTFVLENLHNKMSYKEISEKYYVSISTVKKIFADVFKLFNVSNLEELRILLLQYQVED